MQHYHWMDTRLKRALGAQFKRSMRDDILIFRYPHPSTHLFHTMWCPPLRIVAVNTQTEKSKVVFDQVVQPWRFVKLPAGDMVLYPASSLHSVTSVTCGARVASFFWIQSMIRDDGRRTLLFDLDVAIQQLSRDVPAHPSVVQLTGVYHNLLRQWAEM